MKRAELPFDIRLMNFTSRVLVWIFMLVGLASALYWVSARPVWSIREMRVDGSVQHVSSAELRAQVLPHLQGNWFTISLASTQQLFEQLPWVRRAVVQRVWPLSLQVTLQGQQALGQWQDLDGGAAGLVNTEGELFDADPADLPPATRLLALSGPSGSQARVVQMASRVGVALAPLGWRLNALSLDADGNWSAQFDGARQLQLGSDSDEQAFEQRLRRFVALAPGVEQHYGRQLAAADLRYGNGFAVRLQDAVATAAASNTTQRKGAR